MDLKDKIKCLEHFGFKNEGTGEVIKITCLSKIVDSLRGIRKVKVDIYINNVNNHYLISGTSNESFNLFVGTINTEEFLIQILEAIGVIPIQE